MLEKLLLLSKLIARKNYIRPFSACALLYYNYSKHLAGQCNGNDSSILDNGEEMLPLIASVMLLTLKVSETPISLEKVIKFSLEILKNNISITDLDSHHKV